MTPLGTNNFHKNTYSTHKAGTEKYNKVVPWSVFSHYLIRCGLQGNKAQCDPCDLVVVAQVCILLLTSFELV